MEKKTSLLIVDDDARLRRMLGRILGNEGYEVATAASSADMFALLETATFDLMILDRMLPDGDSVQHAERLRADSKIPIIMLTGKSDAKDRILGLDVGADDYVAKPFDEGELLARVRSVLRRANCVSSENQPAAETNPTVVTGWKLSRHTRSLASPDGYTIPLTEQEYGLLNLFLSHPNQVLSREQIMASVMGREWDPFDRSVDVLVSKLRRKLDTKPPELIQSVRGEGYRFCAPPLETQGLAGTPEVQESTGSEDQGKGAP